MAIQKSFGVIHLESPKEKIYIFESCNIQCSGLTCCKYRIIYRPKFFRYKVVQ